MDMKIKPKYFVRSEAPMLYYRFLTKFSLFAGIVLSILYATSYGVKGQILMCLLSLANSFLCGLSLSLLLRMEWRGVLVLLSIDIFAIMLRVGILGVLEGQGISLASGLGECLGFAVILILNWIYFQKRRPLFTPYLTDILPDKTIGAFSEPSVSQKTAPASPISQDNAPSSDAGSGPAQSGEAPSEPVPSSPPKKRLFRKYETYVVCPGCGSLVPKGTRRCDCGYDLAPSFRKTGRKILIPLRRCAPYLMAVVLLVGGIASGYYMGKSSMQEELSSVQKELADLQERARVLRDECIKLQDENADLILEHTQDAVKLSKYDQLLLESNFLNNRIGFIVSGSRYYHTFQCDVFQSASEFWAHNIEYCESLGYSICPLCH